MERKSVNIKLIVFVVCHALLIIGLFLFVKREYHSDEIWSFGIANGSYGGAIFQDGEGKPINNNEWKSAEVFHENLTVQEDERFHFKIPYVNSVNDAHPPLSFILIHIISSFFPEVFSFWFYIPFNILALVLCDIFIYKTMKLYELSDMVCLGSCFLYALCAGGISTMMFIRMYALMTAFAVIILYLSIKVYLDKQVTLQDAMSIIVVCFLGGLTEYEFYVYAFILAVITGLFLLINRKIKVTLQYGMCMAFGVMASLLMFPEFFNDFFNNVNGSGFDGLIGYPYKIQLWILVSMTLCDVVGFAPSQYAPFGTFLTVVGIFVYCLLVLMPLLFLLRKTSWFATLVSKLKRFLWLTKQKIIKYHFILIVCTVEYVAMIGIFNGLVSSYHMGIATVRYFFVIYPVLVMLFVSLLVCITVHLHNRIGKVFFVGVMVLFVVASQINGEHAFLGRDALDGQSISSVTDSNIIVVNNVYSEVERVAHIIDPSNSFFSVDYDDLETYSERINCAPPSDNTYLVLSEGALFDSILIENVDKANGDALMLKAFDYEEIKQENEEKFINELINNEICKECNYMGREEMLNSVFSYYKLER